MTWVGLEQLVRLSVNSPDVPHADSNYQGWYYRPWNRDEAWEYIRFTASGELEMHHFCTDGCTGTSPLGSPNFCCSALTSGGEPCEGGMKLCLR